jgi:hypothetical protein
LPASFLSIVSRSEAAILRAMLRLSSLLACLPGELQQNRAHGPGGGRASCRVGRLRSRGERDGERSLPLTQRVVRETARQSGLRGRRGAAAAGDRRTDGAGGADRLSSHRSSGRFSGRGRKAAAALPRENDWSAPEGGIRLRTRRGGLKGRVVRLKGRTSRAADARVTHNERAPCAAAGAVENCLLDLRARSVLILALTTGASGSAQPELRRMGNARALRMRCWLRGLTGSPQPPDAREAHRGRTEASASRESQNTC